MAQRSFRQRPLEINKPLELVRDISFLDTADGLPLEILQNQAVAEPVKKEPQVAAPANPNEKPVAVKEIPIPGVTRVATYEIEYLPAYREKHTYLRGKGGTDWNDPSFVEYDLDVEDEVWLKEFNGDQERLTPEKFEAMLWHLDIANSEAIDKMYAFQGAAVADRLTPEVCASTELYSRLEALQMLEETCPSRDTIRVAVYEYWLAKRAKLGRPLLRKLQAPTPLNNQDPYKVFRPREKIHRPQTRRRRENNPDSFERLQTISDNIRMAMQLFELVVKRERKKRDMTYVGTDWQQLQIKQKFNPRNEQEMIEQDYQNAAKNKGLRRPVGFEKLPEAAPAATNALLDFRNKKNKKRKKLGLEAQLHAVAQLPPPPVPPQPQLVCTSATQSLDAAFEQGKLTAPLATQGGSRKWRSRIGRGGRLIFDRCRPFTWEPLVNEEEDNDIKPIYEQPNPYAAYSGKNDLASAAMARLNGQDGGAAPTVLKLKLTPTTNGPASATPAADTGAAPMDVDGKKEEKEATPQTAKPSRASSRQKMAS